MTTVISNALNLPALSLRIQREQRNRETHYPTVSTYRWWARRSHALVGSILDQARDLFGENIVISDPMSGGGTVAVEAARRGLSIFAQDINSWAAFGLRTTLMPVDSAKLSAAATEFAAALASEATFYESEQSKARVATQLHVRTSKCKKCACDNYLFPTLLVSLDKRITGKVSGAWFGCPACGSVSHDCWPKHQYKCPRCTYEAGAIAVDAQRLDIDSTRCVHCDQALVLDSTALANATWHPVLAAISTERGASFDPAACLPQDSLDLPKRFEALKREIPVGKETAALTRWGYRRWSDLFTCRQLATVDRALTFLDAMTIDAPIRERLLLSILGFAEMGGYACRWDAKYLKTYETASNHHFSRIVLSAEVNPLAKIGRGTLFRRLRACVRAAKWFSGSNVSHVECGSSHKQALLGQTVDLILTDPPYYDSVQYAELSRLFRAFAQCAGVDCTDSAETLEAVPNTFLGCDHDKYIERMAAIFTECARTAKPGARMILTFHHARAKAWEALGDALRASDWRIVAVTAVHSENETDFPKRNKNTITADVILECMLRRNDQKSYPIAVAGGSDSTTKALIEMGVTLAEYIETPGTSLWIKFQDRGHDGRHSIFRP